MASITDGSPNPTGPGVAVPTSAPSWFLGSILRGINTVTSLSNRNGVDVEAPAQVPAQAPSSRFHMATRPTTRQQPIMSEIAPPANVGQFVTGDEVHMYDSDEGRTGDAMKIVMSNLSHAYDATAREDVIGFYLSIIAMSFPSMRTHCLTYITNCSYTCLHLKLPSEAPAHLLDSEPSVPTSHLWVNVGQLLLLPFKNINSSSYCNYMRSRISALAANAGVDQREVGICVSDIVAGKISSYFGSDHVFRKELLHELLNQSASGLAGGTVPGRICDYVLGILEYTDMTPIPLIYNSLLLCNSPVLRDPRTLCESIRFADALKAVVNCTDPKYFRIEGPVESFQLIERGKFPLLLAVAVKLRSGCGSSFENYVYTDPALDEVVDSLVDLHNTQMGPSSSFHPVYQAAIAFLTT